MTQGAYVLVENLTNLLLAEEELIEAEASIEEEADTTLPSVSYEEDLRKPDLLAGYTGWKEKELLTHEEEIKFGKIVQGQDSTPSMKENARWILVLHNIRWAAQRVLRFPRITQEEDDDLLQEALLGLHRASGKYDPKRGFRFVTYATRWIDLFIFRYYYRKGNLVPIPHEYIDKVVRVRSFIARYRKTYGVQPRLQDIAEHLTCSRPEAFKIMRYYVFSIVSLNTVMPSQEGKEDEYLENLSGGGPSPECYLVIREELGDIYDKLVFTRASIERFLQEITFLGLGSPDDIQTLKLRLGIFSFHGMKGPDVGKCMGGISRQAVDKRLERFWRRCAKYKRPETEEWLEGALHDLRSFYITLGLNME